MAKRAKKAKSIVSKPKKAGRKPKASSNNAVKARKAQLKARKSKILTAIEHSARKGHSNDAIYERHGKAAHLVGMSRKHVIEHAYRIRNKHNIKPAAKAAVVHTGEPKSAEKIAALRKRLAPLKARVDKEKRVKAFGELKAKVKTAKAAGIDLREFKPKTTKPKATVKKAPAEKKVEAPKAPKAPKAKKAEKVMRAHGTSAKSLRKAARKSALKAMAPGEAAIPHISMG